MIALASLWLPILLSAVAVFFISSLVHMVLGYHRSDYQQLPDERATLTSLREKKLPPALYHFPYANSPKEMGTPEMVAKLTEGPVGILVLMPNRPMTMGKFLGQWMGYCLLVSLVIASVGALVLPRGTDPLLVFRVTGTIALLAYGLANIVDSIWKAYPWRVTGKHIVDGVLYALATGAIFAWLWPS